MWTDFYRNVTTLRLTYGMSRRLSHSLRRRCSLHRTWAIGHQSTDIKVLSTELSRQLRNFAATEPSKLPTSDRIICAVKFSIKNIATLQPEPHP